VGIWALAQTLVNALETSHWPHATETPAAWPAISQWSFSRPSLAIKGVSFVAATRQPICWLRELGFPVVFFIPAQPVLASKPSSGADWPDHDQFVVRFLPDPPSGALRK